MVGIGLAGGVFAMHDENVAHLLFVLAGEVLDEFLVVAVAGEGLDGGEFGTHLVLGAEDGDLAVAAHDFGPEGGGGTIADRQDGGLGIFDVVGEMVLHTAGLHHARSGDDDAGTVVGVEFFGVGDAADVVHLLEAERVGVGFDVLLQLLVESLAMDAEDVGGSHGERTVNEDFHIRQIIFIFKGLQGIHNLLCTADGEGGNDEFAFTLRHRVFDDHHEVVFRLADGSVEAIAIGGFGDDVVGLREGFGIGEDGLAVPPDVAGVAERSLLTPFFDGDIDGAAAEHVAGVDELKLEVGGNVIEKMVGDADETAHAGHRILHGVDGFDRGEALESAFLVELGGIGLLDAAGVGEHDGAEVAGGRGAEHRALEAHLHHVWNQAGVVDVRVGKDDVVNVARVEAEVAVHAVGLQTFTLVHAAVEQNFHALVGGEKEFTTGNFCCCT